MDRRPRNRCPRDDFPGSSRRRWGRALSGPVSAWTVFLGAILAAALAACGDSGSEGGHEGEPGTRAAGPSRRTSGPLGTSSSPSETGGRPGGEQAGSPGLTNRLERARDLLNLAQFDRARAELEALGPGAQEDPEVAYQLAKIARYGNGDLDEATRLLRGALAKRPSSIKIALALYEILDLTHQDDQAVAILRKIVEENPEYLEFRVSYTLKLGNVVFRLPGDPTTRSLLEHRALQLETILDQRPFNPIAMDLLAVTYLGMGDFETALRSSQVLESLLGGSPRGAITPYAVIEREAVCHYKMGRFEKALQLYQKAGQVAMGDPRGAARFMRRVRWGIRLCTLNLGRPLTSIPPGLQFHSASETVPAPPDQSFVEEARRLGIDKLDGAGPSAWADVDGDGRLDLFVSGCNTFCALYIGQEDGTFRDGTREAGLGDLESGWGAVLTDLDNDGDPDLFMIRDGWLGCKANALFENTGGGHFREITDQAGLGDPGSGFSGSVFDYDRDGLLDLLIANNVVGDGSNNRLYRNLGGLRFEDVTERAGLIEKGPPRTIGIGVFDYDKDGDQDIFASGYLSPNRLFRNEGNGTFTEVGAAAGVRGTSQQQAFIVFLADFDNDTWPDIVSTQWEHRWELVLGCTEQPGSEPDAFRAHVWKNLGNGKFREINARIPACGSMGGNFGDLDNDGDLDIYLGTGGPSVGRLEPNVMLYNDGQMHFANVTSAFDVGHVGKGHGVTMADPDRDGDLDIYSPQGGFFHGDPWANVYYRNDCHNGNHWLWLKLKGSKGPPDATGTQVTLQIGSQRRWAELQNGVAFGSSNEPGLHFGLGAAKVIDRIEILWPSGTRQVLEQVAADQYLSLTEP